MGVILAVGRDLPQVQALEEFEPGAATRILSADGRVLGEFFVHKRLPLPLDLIPLQLQQAVIAVEDRRFYKHPGLDLIRNIGALIADIRTRRLAQGASTITQQLARNLFLTSRKTLRRKLKEIFLALQIERRHTKSEILRLYLNQIYFGAGAYGVAAAAETYFNKKVADLTLEESALLAGLPKSPGGYSPFRRPGKALARRRIVLRAMVREGFITPEQAMDAAETPLDLAPRGTKPGLAPYFVEHVKNFIVGLLGQNAVYKGGLKVKTTLDMKTQLAAEKALKKGLDRLDRQLNQGQAPGLEPEKPQGALVALKAGSGRILAWAGGADFRQSSFDRVSQASRQPGSAFKPIVYAAAVESGLTQADRVWDAPIIYRLPGQKTPWRPQNYSRRFEGEITLRRALEVSGNIPAIKLLGRVGVDNVIRTARGLGLNSRLARNLTLALGTSEVTLLELAAAYNTLAGGGVWTEPHFVLEIQNRSGRVIYQARPRRRVALSPETAYIMTDMLRGVVNHGTAKRAKALARPVAGKTGTTDSFRDALFVGYSPGVLAAVRVGFDSNRSLGPGRTGARVALPIWVDFMDQALKDKPVRDFRRPVNVVMAPMDRFSGDLARPKDKGAVIAAFKAGSEPR